MCYFWCITVLILGLQAIFRNFLTKKGIFVKPSQLLPVPVAPSLVAGFIRKEFIPDTNKIVLDWLGSLTNVWNTEVIGMMAEEFLQQIQNNHYPKIPFTANMTRLRFAKIIRIKLARIQARHQLENHLATTDDLMAKAKAMKAKGRSDKNSRARARCATVHIH